MKKLLTLFICAYFLIQSGAYAQVPPPSEVSSQNNTTTQAAAPVSTPIPAPIEVSSQTETQQTSTAPTITPIPEATPVPDTNTRHDNAILLQNIIFTNESLTNYKLQISSYDVKHYLCRLENTEAILEKSFYQKFCWV